ncbi:TrkA family potassium uptake protein [Paenibacillus sp. UNC499MF]|uniref:potassium channel family protein n=1 Tax=Paenibacillus sp. UNC499MF TaxID=1502751 RepID=UPI0008A07290|nr:TrkA family potassium uptake protein [Paenibacillus sp. UNC499MF]SEG39453.1 trk system potassium uptake protein TrkA [Paenibacillus sp. UNC499MF]
MKKQFAVIGMGRFGSSVAKNLTGLGFEVLALDHSEERIQEISTVVTHSVQVDCTDEEALKALGIRNFDVVVVAIGENIQASILATLLLKDIGIPTIVVKAANDLHGKVLRKIGADKIIYPERDMGQRVAHHLISPNILDYIELSSEHSILEMKANDRMIGKNLRDLDLRAKFQCNVIAIKRQEQLIIPPPVEAPIQPGEILIVLGNNKDLKRFEVEYSE